MRLYVSRGRSHRAATHGPETLFIQLNGVGRVNTKHSKQGSTWANLLEFLYGVEAGGWDQLLHGGEGMDTSHYHL